MLVEIRFRPFSLLLQKRQQKDECLARARPCAHHQVIATEGNRESVGLDGVGCDDAHRAELERTAFRGKKVEVARFKGLGVFLK